MNVFKAIFQRFRKLLRNSNFKECLSINCFQLYLECVPRTISYHLYFLRICKVWSMLHQGQWNEFRIKKAILCLYILFSLFFSFFIKKLCFYYFHFFSWWSIKFPQQNINQSETRIGDEKLSVELYVNIDSQKQLFRFVQNNLKYAALKFCFTFCFCFFIYIPEELHWCSIRPWLSNVSWRILKTRRIGKKCAINQKSYFSYYNFQQTLETCSWNVAIIMKRTYYLSCQTES